MEFHHSFSTTAAATICFLIVTAILLHILKINRASREPPRAEGAWPIIGHLHLLGGSQLPHKVLGHMAEKYGPIFTINLGVHQALVVSNGEIAKECFITNDTIFASRPRSKAAELMGYNYAMFGLSPYGDYWRQVRKIVMLEVLSPRKVEMLGHVRVSELKASMKDLFMAWVKNKDSENSIMVEVEMKQWFGNFVLNVLVTIIFGNRLSQHNNEEGVRFQEAVRKFFKLMGAFVLSDFIPYLKHLDVGGYEKTMKVTAKEMDDIIKGWLKEHKREKESGPQHEGNRVFMDVLISVLEGASKEDFLGFDNDTIVKATCLTILIAGLDTTSVTLTWALSLLLNNPKALEIAQDEIDKHVGRDRLVQESDIKNLVYLDAIIKETLRLYPAGPLSVPRESMEDCIVAGYNIPKGTRLLVNL